MHTTTLMPGWNVPPWLQGQRILTLASTLSPLCQFVTNMALSRVWRVSRFTPNFQTVFEYISSLLHYFTALHYLESEGAGWKRCTTWTSGQFITELTSQTNSNYTQIHLALYLFRLIDQASVSYQHSVWWWLFILRVVTHNSCHITWTSVWKCINKHTVYSVKDPECNI